MGLFGFLARLLGLQEKRYPFMDKPMADWNDRDVHEAAMVAAGNKHSQRRRYDPGVYGEGPYEADVKDSNGNTHFVRGRSYEELVNTTRDIMGDDVVNDDFYIYEVRKKGKYNDDSVWDFNRDLRG